MVGYDDLAIIGISFLKRNWKPILFIGIGLAAAGYIWWLRDSVADLERDLMAAQKAELAAITERDVFQASADAQAQGVRDRGRAIDNLNLQIKGLVSLWHSTRADAERVKAETIARAAVYAAAERVMKEWANDPNADPADIALRNFECLRQLQQAGSAPTPGAC